MSNLDKDKLLSFINEKWRNKACVMCGNAKWSLDDTIYELRKYNDGNLIIGGGGPIFPIVPVVCSNCGNTIFINPLVAKAMGGEEK